MHSFLHDELRLISAALKNPATYLFALAGGLWAWPYVGGEFTYFWPLALLATLLTIIAMADSAHKLLPLLPMAAVAGVGLLANPLLGSWPQMLLGGVLAAAGLALVGQVGRWLAGRPALGLGDILLGFALGIWLGPIGLIPWLAAVAGLGLLMVLYRRLCNQSGTMPFAPILCLAAWLALLHGYLYYQLILPS